MLPARIFRLRSVLMACAALAAPCALGGQPLVRPGVYVRILAPSVADSLLTGMVLEIDSASLLLAPASTRSRTVALRDIERVEVRGPGAPRTLTGTLVGTVAGTVVGYQVCRIASGLPHANCPELRGAVTGGVMGLVLGTLLGSAIRGPDRWHPAVAPRW
jgi:hypothetical protein